MSFETWRMEFYPVPAHEVKTEDALAHSDRKWKGLRSEVLERHGVKKWQDQIEEIIESEGGLSIDDGSCALCQVYRHHHKCPTCPLTLVRGGVPCDVVMVGESRRGSPYLAWLDDDDPEPMIALLEKAISRVANDVVPQMVPTAVCSFGRFESVSHS